MRLDATVNIDCWILYPTVTIPLAAPIWSRVTSWPHLDSSLSVTSSYSEVMPALRIAMMIAPNGTEVA